ncbi:MAG: hypothetical protein RBR20_12890 [Desulfobacterales bacterium]|jgi:hypothetical protein|nr:hypothetical protein [Desulfobacteraceae bacterium]MDD3991040.1 hypothetical protein [Desulfobacteraceae bacterium]MDY0313003.1 hypothetical protein [Desulfobacterales bacterium]
MYDIIVTIAVTMAVFGVFVAGLALRQRRHPDRTGGGGCAHHSGPIRCLDCPSRAGTASPRPESG